MAITIPIIFIAIEAALPVQEMENGENPIVTQIRINGINQYYGNVREDASTSSRKVGEVYQRQYYDVISSKTVDKHTWYEIETLTGIHGYIIDENVSLQESLNNRVVKLIAEEKFEEASELIENVKQFRTAVSIEADGELQKADAELDAVIEKADNQRNYGEANKLFDEKNYKKALAIMSELAGKSYDDSEVRFNSMMDSLYKKACTARDEWKYSRATDYFGILSTYDYMDSQERYEESSAAVLADREAINAIVGEFRADSIEKAPWSICLKINNNGTFAYSVNDDKEFTGGSWHTYVYDVDKGVYHMEWGFMKYDATLSSDGKVFKIVFTGDEDDRWMSDAGTYYRVE